MFELAEVSGENGSASFWDVDITSLGVIENDLVIVAVETPTAATISDISDTSDVDQVFTQEDTRTGGAGQTIYLSKLVGAGGLPTTLRIDFASNESGAYIITRIRGNATTTPIEQKAYQTSADSDGTGNSTDFLETASATPTQNDSLLMGVFGRDITGSPGASEVSGWTLLGDGLQAENAHIVVAYKVQTTAQAETVRVNVGDSGLYDTFIFAVKPAAAAAAASLVIPRRADRGLCMR